MQPGDLIGNRFRIIALAGAGGMGSVFRALDTASGGQVALKLLAPTGGGEAERLLREARVLSELHHPGIVRHIAHGLTAAGRPYLAMEWLEGESLADRLTRGRLEVDECLLLAERVAPALGAAHQRGVVHRDIKPSNLFLPGDDLDRVILLDFGVARLADATVAMTRTGMVVGTPLYMAPEQARGERDVDSRADLFSLGCVLFECLTGEPPFRGPHPMAVLARILMEEAPRLGSVRADVPDGLDELVASMLAKDPDQRPRDGSALVVELAALSRVGVPHTTRKPARPVLTGEERRLLSVVVVAAEGSGRPDLTATADRAAGDDPLAAARRCAEGYGGRLEQLADGSVVVTLSSAGVATDQAVLAARCSLALRDLLPERPLALSTGHGELTSTVPVGEVIDRAVRLLWGEDGRSLSAAGLVAVDATTAGLLGGRFRTSQTGARFTLEHEQEPAVGNRTLLGRPTPCLGRDRELATLEALFAESVGEPVARVALVTGPAGIGKSRLLSELLGRLRRHGEAEVWIGRGDPMRAGEPFGMVAPAVRRAAAISDGLPPGERRRRLRERIALTVPPADAERVTVFVGELVGVAFGDDESVQLAAARQNAMLMSDQVHRAFEDWLAAELSRRPLLVLLDDLQWGDLPTVQLLDRCLRSFHDRALTVVAVARPEVDDLFPRLWELRNPQLIRLGGLSQRASERLAREVLGEAAPETVARVVEQSGGNPFFLEELLRATAEGATAMPDTVLAVLESRLAPLAPAARRVLRAGSVFGQRFRRSGVGHLLGSDAGADQLEGWLRDLTEQELLTRLADSRLPDEEAYLFRHALLREAVYTTLTDSDRRLGHRLAGEWLEAAGEAEPRVLAEHLERGGEPARARPHYLQAARQALKGNDYATATELADRCVRLGAEGEELGLAWLVLAEANYWRGDAEPAERCAAEAMLHLAPGTTAWYAAAALLGSTAGRQTHVDALEALASRLLESTAVEQTAAAPALAATAVGLLHAGRYPLAERLLAALGSPDSPALEGRPYAAAWVERGHGMRAAYRSAPAISLRLMESSAAHFEAAGDLRTACLQWGNVGYLKREMGLAGEAEVALRSVLEMAQRLGLDHVEATARHNLGPAVALQGRLEEGAALERQAVETFARQGDLRFEGTSRVYLALILIETGDLDQAEQQAGRAIEVLAAVPQERAYALAALGEVLRRRGRSAEALARAEEGAALLESIGGGDEGESLIRLALVEARLDAGDREGAVAAITVARDRLQQRAAEISDQSWRQSFLAALPVNARTLALARQLLGE